MEWYSKDNIPVKNVYYMFYYAFQAMNLKPYDFKDIAKEDFKDVRDLLAAILGKGISLQVRQGLYREYLDRQEDVPSLRGKLDINGTIRNKIAQRQLLSCEYDELSENNLGNQILKTTALLLLREGDDVVKPKRKAALRRELAYFSAVDEIDPITIQWSTLRFHKNNQIYRTLLYFCQLVLQEMLMSTGSDKYKKHKLKSFLDKDNMPKLYEKFILGYYKEKFAPVKKFGFNVGAREISWSCEEKDSVLPSMNTDIMLSHNHNDEVLIIDAKWYDQTLEESWQSPGTFKVNSGNLYQIFTYVTNKAREKDKVSKKMPRKVSGMLLYARTYKKGEEGEVLDLDTPKKNLPQKKKHILDPDNNLGGPYTMGGQHEIHVRTLDLTKDFEGESGLRAQLDSIAEYFFPKKIFPKKN